MSLKACPYCSEMISDKSNHCVKCGKDISASDWNITCIECGARLNAINQFCPVCGCPVDALVENGNSEELSGNASPSSVKMVNVENSTSVSSNRPKVWIPIIAVIIALLCGFIVWKVYFSGPKVDFKNIYYECKCSTKWAKYGSSYLRIDTNPHDKDLDDYLSEDWSSSREAINAIQDINDELGLPDYLYEDMMNTTANQGRQREEFEDLGIKVTWTYHPDSGLEVSYELL